MVGDRLDTDILFGQNGGCKTLLVLSGNSNACYFLFSWHHIFAPMMISSLLVGVTSLQMLQSPSNSIQPDFYTNKISDLVTLKAAAVWMRRITSFVIVFKLQNIAVLYIIPIYEPNMIFDCTGTVLIDYDFSFSFLTRSDVWFIA